MTTQTTPAGRQGDAVITAPPAAAPRPSLLDRLGALLIQRTDLVALVILVVALIGYLFNLGGWLITDDEGSYFYQTWRISLGEIPYRDFLTPQLPLFLGIGGLAQRVFGPAPVPLRVLSVLAVMAAAWALYRILRRYVTPPLALVGMIAFLAFPDVYAVGRVFRSEPYMLLFISLGLWAFVLAEERRRWPWWVLAGVLFGLGILTKLFAALAFGGVLLYVLSPWRGRTNALALAEVEGRRGAARPPAWDWGGLRARLPEAAALLVPAGLVAGGVLLAFLIAVPETYTAIFGHQLMQGSQLSHLDVFWKGVEFYRVYFGQYAPILVFALPMAVVVWRRGGRWTLLTWQLPTVIAFALLSRELWARHLVYLAPALAGLFAASLEPMLAWSRRGFLLLAIIGAVLLPWLFNDSVQAHYSETGTWRVADFLAAEAGPAGSFLSDYPELNFYAQLPTGYAAASLSQGAASSGQISGMELLRELDAMGGNNIVVDISEFGQLRFLRDRKAFQAAIDAAFTPIGFFNRAQQQLQVYRRNGTSPPGSELNFGNQLTFFSGGPAADTVASGDSVPIHLRFGVRAPASADRERTPLSENYVAFVHLQDGEGNIWGSDDGALTNALKKQTSQWQAGELNVDRFNLRVRPGTPPGVYDMVVGVYRLSDGTRLDILNAQGNPVGTEHKLGQLNVGPAARRPATADLGLATSMDADLGPARLVGYGVDRAAADAGDSLRVELGWQGEQLVEGLVALSLIGAAGEVSRQTFPLQVAAGEVVLGQYNVPIDADVPGGDYRLRARLIAADGAPLGEAVDLAPLSIQPVAASFAKPPISHPLRVDLGERVDLAGYDLGADRVAPGDSIELTLYWHPQGRLTQGLKVFTHLVGPDGRIVAQRDSIPVEGARPTTGWRPGEYIADRYRIAVPRDAAPGRYELRVGLYDPTTGERLPVSADGAPQPDGQVRLSEVTVG